jgi:hypothetical protein
MKNIRAKQFKDLILKKASVNRDENLPYIAEVILKKCRITSYVASLPLAEIDKLGITILKIIFIECIFDNAVTIKKDPDDLNRIDLDFRDCLFMKKIKIRGHAFQVFFWKTNANIIEVTDIGMLTINHTEVQLIDFYRYGSGMLTFYPGGGNKITSMKFYNMSDKDGLYVSECHESMAIILRNFFPLLSIKSIYADRGSFLGAKA